MSKYEHVGASGRKFEAGGTEWKFVEVARRSREVGGSGWK